MPPQQGGDVDSNSPDFLSSGLHSRKNVTSVPLPSAFHRAKVMLGEFSDGALDPRRARGIAIFPKMELEKGEEKALPAGASTLAQAANRDTD
jgi:hypothetical protein